MLLTGRKN